LNSGVPQEEPKKKAQSLIDALPGNSLVSKAAILSAGAAVSVAAVSNEFYVFNEETIVAFSLLTVFFAAAKYGSPAYNSWAASQQEKMSAILNSAREHHTSSVKGRIENVKELSGVVDITKNLFEVSKVRSWNEASSFASPHWLMNFLQETAKLEAEAYALEQKTTIAAEAKTVLDSWVRYEGQVKTRQQRELAESIIAKIEKELENPKVLKQILDQSVTDIESKLLNKVH
jgi:F-type H+-transporting ATPase subunit b